ncbi:MAG: alkaline phosphatase family protein [Candidatus Dormiibacterota bacterium]
MRIPETWKTRIALSAIAAVLLAAGLFLGLSHIKSGQVVGPSQAPSSSPSTSSGSAAPKPVRSEPHVLVIMEENQGYNATQTDCGTANSYFCQLAGEYASVVPWFGVAHPSLPNYLAVTSGSTQGCSSDTCSGPYPVDNLGDQLTVAGIPWTAYMESMPAPCYQGVSDGEYAKKHDPFVFYADLLDGPVCAAHVLPYPGPSGLLSTLNGTSPPDFVWITPNLIDDMHDGTVAEGNAWLETNLEPILSSAWFTSYRSTVIVTEDENDHEPTGSCCGDAAGGQIPELVISHRARGRGIVSLTGDQYGTLRTIEEAFGLPLLGAAADPANGDLNQLFG